MTNIVMLIRDRYKLTKQALESLVAHTDREDYTLLIVDDGSEDFRVRALISQFVLFHPNAQAVRVEGSGHNVGKLKSLGVAASMILHPLADEDDWLYISDNDVYFTDGWLKTLVGGAEEFEWQGYSLFGGQYHPFIGIDGEEVRDQYVVRSVSVLDGVSWLMRRKTWGRYYTAKGVLGSTTASGTCQGEDVQFCEWLRSKNELIGVISELNRLPLVLHTGLTNTAGQPAPGFDIRSQNKVQGVLYE